MRGSSYNPSAPWTQKPTIRDGSLLSWGALHLQLALCQNKATRLQARSPLRREYVAEALERQEFTVLNFLEKCFKRVALAITQNDT